MFGRDFCNNGAPFDDMMRRALPRFHGLQRFELIVIV